MKKWFTLIAAMVALITMVSENITHAATQNSPVAKEIERVANGSDYLAFGDPDHNHLDIYHFVRNPEILDALANKGYKSIAIEAPLYLQSVMDLYRKSKISRVAFIHASDMVFENAFADDKAYLNMLADFIDSAKAKNIRLYAVDGAPGMLSAGNAMNFHLITSQMATAWAQTITAHPNIGKMSAKDRQALLQKAVEPFNVDYTRIVGREQQAQQLKQRQGIDITERFQHDSETAARIKDLRRSGKVAFIYGNLHLERSNRDRMGGDIDHHLGDNNVATINVYYDQQKYEKANGGALWQRMADPKSQPLFADEAPLWNKLKGAPDRPEFSLDLKRGVWTDHTTGTQSKVALP